jgi:hypothetical protein
LLLIFEETKKRLKIRITAVRKRKMKKTLFLSLLFILYLSLSAFATLFNETDTFIITTYYPSAYGRYNRLQTRKLGVGTNYNQIKSLAPGQLYVENSVILKALANDPPVVPSKKGQIIYSDADDMLKFNNGTAWVNATSTGYSACAANTSCGACPTEAKMCRPSDWISPTSCPACGTQYIGTYTRSWDPTAPAATRIITITGTTCGSNTDTLIGTACTYCGAVAGCTGCCSSQCWQTTEYRICTK